MRPVREDPADIEGNGIAVVADQRFSEAELVESLIPNLRNAVRVGPAAADTGVGAVEEEQCGDPFGVQAGEALHGVGADVMGNEAGAFDLQGVHQGNEIGRDDIGRPRRKSQRSGAMAEPGNLSPGKRRVSLPGEQGAGQVATVEDKGKNIEGQQRQIPN